jgi:predicted nucleotidyltransferase
MNRQETLIEYLKQQLIDYSGIKAMYLKGSLASDTGDDYSDVDFYCLVNEKHYDKLLEDRMKILSTFKPIVYESNVNFGYPQVIVIYDNNLHLDFYVTKDVPENSTSEIKAVYDPENLLQSYQSMKRDDGNQTVNRLSEIIYTFHELDIAIKRSDDIWSMRLMSHMICDLGLVFCSTYCPDKPVAHLKGVYNHLPCHYQKMIDEILGTMTPENIQACILKFIELYDEVIADLDTEIKNQIDFRYYNYIKEHVFRRNDDN